ncbi:MAG: CPBP family intramembrane metalloprotease, partial [Clostridiales Family XIII bacterium]|nr:CPBP family intramembrane metalloprotease [Clostridiales Family XIII bacterium]
MYDQSNLQGHPSKQLRRDLRVIVLTIGLFFAIELLLMTTLQFAAALSMPGAAAALAAGDAMGFAAYLASTASTPGIIVQLSPSVCILFGTMAFLIVRRRMFADLAAPAAAKISPGRFLGFAAAILGVGFAASLLGSAVDALLRAIGTDLSLTGLLMEATGSMVSPAGIAYLVVIGPICEELIFRSAVMGRLVRHGENFAIVVSSVLFGLYHIILFQALYAIPLGMILGYVALRHSLRAAIGLHILNNGIQALGMVLSALGAETASLVVISGLNILGLAAFVVLTIRNRVAVRQGIRTGRSDRTVYR